MSTPHTRLPIVPSDLPTGSLRSDGKRNWVQPADVSGRYNSARMVAFFILSAIMVALPWLKLGGHPAVFLDIEHRRFFLFGSVLNAQDGPLLFLVLAGMAFGLVYTTALFGRLWCGWACPQTVFLEGIYRKIERLIEGSREKRIRRDAGDWTFDKVWRKTVKQAFFVLVSAALAHQFVAYFVSWEQLWAMMNGPPSAHPEAFAWVAGIAVLLYLNFAWFREQFCVIVCPYGRLQSVLMDEHSLVAGYEERRGEPRGKATDPNAGACVDCGRCVAVCPTGIDIRAGVQLDCIACTACIDACDEIMDKLQRPRGLIRYDSLAGLKGEPRRILRPRMVIYTAILLAGVLATVLVTRERKEFEANLIRLPGPPYVLDGETVRNAFNIHLVNKRSERATLTLTPVASPGVTFLVPLASFTLDPLASAHAPVFITFPRASFHGDFTARLRVRRQGAPEEETRVVTIPVLGPAAGR